MRVASSHSCENQDSEILSTHEELAASLRGTAAEVESGEARVTLWSVSREMRTKAI